MTTKPLKEPFDPALDAPIALTPDQIEQVVGGFFSLGPWLGAATAVSGGGGGTLGPRSPYPTVTTGVVTPTLPLPGF
jgi:hypothetical protein